MQEYITQKLYEHFTFQKVLDNVQGRMRATQWFGENNTTFYKTLGKDGHGGIDFRATIGTPSYAAIDGTVIGVFSDEYRDGITGEYVKYESEVVTIDGDEYKIILNHYHLHKANVKKGDNVVAGQKICETGNTGKYTSGPHLHFNVKPYVKKDGKWEIAFYENGYYGDIDPYPFFFRQDFTSAPDDEPVLLPKRLYKSISSPKVYYQNKYNKPVWIEDGETFDFGVLEGWWKHPIQEVRGKLKEDLILNVKV